MNFLKWLAESKANKEVNFLLIMFLEKYPFVFDLYGNSDVWLHVSSVLDMLPENMTIKKDAFELYAHVLMAMNCFKEHPDSCKLLIDWLKDNLTIIRARRHITRDDIIDLRILLETSEGVNDFLDKI